MVFAHLLLILHWEGFLLVSHLWILFSSLGSTASINEGMYSGFFLAWTAFISFFLIEVFTTGKSFVEVLVALGGEEMGSDW